MQLDTTQHTIKCIMKVDPLCPIAFFFVMRSIVQCISTTVDSPQSPLATWHRVSVAHIDYLTNVFQAI